MGKTSAFEKQIQDLIWGNIAIPNIGDTNGIPAAAVSGNFFMRLYTDAVVASDSVIGQECAYTGYVPGGVAIARATGVVVSGNNVKNVSKITFGACTAGEETVKYVAIWKNNSSNDVNDRMYFKELATPLTVQPGIIPEIPANALNINEN